MKQKNTQLCNNKIEVQNLCFGYIKKPLCLKDINFSLKNGETLGVLGGEGMGKTSLLRILAGLEDQFFGSIKYNNQDFKAVKISDKKISYLPTLPVFFENKTLRYNLDYLFKVEEMTPLTDEQIYAIFKKFYFEKNLYEKVKRLSSSDKKIFAIIRSYIKNPQVILIDDQTLLETKENINKIKNAILTLLDLKNHSKTAILAMENKDMLIECDKYLYLSYSSGKLEKSLKDFINNPSDINIYNYFDGAMKEFYISKEDGYYLCDYVTTDNGKKGRKKVVNKELVTRLKIDSKYFDGLNKMMLTEGESCKVILGCEDSYEWESLDNSKLDSQLGNYLHLFEYDTGVKIL